MRDERYGTRETIELLDRLTTATRPGAVVGVTIFSKVDPQHFGAFDSAFLTLCYVTGGDPWPDSLPKASRGGWGGGGRNREAAMKRGSRMACEMEGTRRTRRKYTRSKNKSDFSNQKPKLPNGRRSASAVCAAPPGLRVADETGNFEVPSRDSPFRAQLRSSTRTGRPTGRSGDTSWRTR